MRKLRKENNCLNCGNTVEERYCSHCGQENVEPREPFKHIFTHFVTDYLHLDEKFWSSIRPLLFKPGYLTNQYNAGRRASYVHPFRLYIFITIIFFIFSPGLGGSKKEPIRLDESTSAKDSSLMSDAVKSKRDSLMADVLNSNGDTALTDALKLNGDSALADVDSALVDSSGEVSYYASTDSMDISFDDDKFVSYDTSIEQYRAKQMALPEDQRDGMIARFLKERSITAKNSGKNLRDTVNNNFKKNTSKMIFCLLPIFALFLKLFFRKEKHFYVEHFFHSVYIHSFLFLMLLIFGSITKFLPNDYAVYMSILAILLIVVYIYVSCKVVYKEHPMLIIIKLLMITFLYFFALMILIIVNALISFVML